MAAQGKQQAPREIFAQAVAGGPMKPDERARFRCQLADVKAKDDARRAAPSPQADLELAE